MRYLHEVLDTQPPLPPTLSTPSSFAAAAVCVPLLLMLFDGTVVYLIALSDKVLVWRT